MTTITDTITGIPQLAVLSGISSSKLREVAAQCTPPAQHPGPGRRWLFTPEDAAALVELAQGR